MAGHPKLIALSEPLRGQTFELSQPEYTVGRLENCNICIPDPTISSRHCTLAIGDDGTYTLTDHGSTNGTRVNGMRVQSQKLANSDILQFGGVEMLFESQEKFSTTVLSTQTQINLAASSGRASVSEMPNFSPFGSRSSFAGSGNKWARRSFNAVIVLVGLAILVAIGMLMKHLIIG